MRRIARTLGVAAMFLVASAHVGSPDTWFEGSAGPYRVTVQIEPAGVIPGVANVYVRVHGDPVTGVTVMGNKFDATGGAPPPEAAEAVAGDAGLYLGKLWIMSGGSNSVTVNVQGARGSGTAVIPVVAVAYSRLRLDKPMAVGLSAMGLFLFAGLVTIIGAAVREGVLPPGERPTPKRLRRARIAMAVTSLMLVALLAGGWTWWQSEDAGYVARMYKPLSAKASIANGPAGAVLNLAIVDSPWVHRNDSAWLNSRDASSWTPLVEDHGKLMHLFMIRDDMAAFAHLHPSTVDSVTFPSPLPPLPAGKYKVFADIVHESGFTHTMVTSVEIGADAAAVPTATGNGQPVTGSGQRVTGDRQRVPVTGRLSVDDSWFAGPVAKGTPTYSLGGGATMTWAKGDAPIVADRPASLRFEIRNADGSPAILEPYMGMPGHAVVARNDGAVFVHLHPAGTISMASQMAFAMRQPGDSIRGRLGKRISEMELSGMSRATVDSNIITFPYAFPKAGDYRVWVQVKRGGQVMTGAFDATVTEGEEGS